MSLHDQEVIQAQMAGNSWMHFFHVLRKQALITLLYLIAAMFAKYFFNWMWALIPLALAVFSGVECFKAGKTLFKLLQLENK